MLEQRPFKITNSILHKIDIEDLSIRGIELYVKRDDLIHPLVSGNKWRKLKYNILQAQSNSSKGILTFGGAFSNHLIATAVACKEFNLESIGMVRGEELNATSNETLRRCHELGMKLIFLDRSTYQLRNDWEYQYQLKNEFQGFYVVPEGGANFYGMIGCQEIWKEIPFEFSDLFLAQGTTTTSCGLLLSKPPNTNLHVIPVLKGFDAKEEMLNLLKQATHDSESNSDLLKEVKIHSKYHFGGYGKYSPELIEFIQETQKKYDLPIDHVYTAKAFYGMLDVLKENEYDGKTIIFLHTGGLQGSDFYKS